MSRARFALLAALGVAARGMSAQTTASGPDIFRSATGGFIALSVPDLAASVRWYEEKLGLHRILTVGRMDHIVGVVALEAGGLIVEIIQRDDARVAAGAPELTHGIAKAGIIVSDFDRVVAELRARGMGFMNGPFPARATVRANVSFQDNAGNVLQVFGGYAP